MPQARPGSFFREVGDLRGGDGLLGQQHRNAVVDAEHLLAVAGQQRLAQGQRLGAAVGLEHGAGADRAVECLQALGVQQGQGLAGVGRAQQVKQLAIHGFFVLRGRWLEYVFKAGDGQ